MRKLFGASVGALLLMLAPVAATASSDHSRGNRGTSGVATQPQPLSGADQNSGGANGHCPGGPYCSTRDGSPSMNGNGNGQAVGKPCAGCVGKADNKNPHGQYPNGSDQNNGYECDGNHGIGRTNPAHTGCAPGVTTTPSPTPPGIPGSPGRPGSPGGPGSHGGPGSAGGTTPPCKQIAPGTVIPPTMKIPLCSPTHGVNAGTPSGTITHGVAETGPSTATSAATGVPPRATREFASGTTPTAASNGSGTLPFTGEDIALVASVGLLLLGAGLLQRRASNSGDTL